MLGQWPTLVFFSSGDPDLSESHALSRSGIKEYEVLLPQKPGESFGERQGGKVYRD
jgi:hypothetical protein